MAAGPQFGCPKFTFDRISGHFRSICNFNFILKFLHNGCRRPFWMSEIHFRSHFWSFQIDTQLNFFGKFLIKWLPSAILDIRNSLSIAFLAILDQYEKIYLFNFTKWPPALILDVRNSLSGHFRSICNFNLVLNFWYNGCRRTILDVRNSLSIAFLAISDRYAT